MASPTVVGEVDQHDNSTQLPPLVLSTFVKSFEFLSTKDDNQVQLRASLDHDVPPQFPPSTPEAVRTFFSSVANPTEILSSKLVSRVEGTDVIKGGYNFVHILNLDVGQSHPLFPFVLRFPIDPDSISRSQTRTAVGCMLYCQRHTELNIPTPVVYAYNCTYGSEFIAMEYLDGDTLSHVWLDIPEEDKQNVIHQIVEIMRSMRTKASFRVIGGISPDGSACPLVDGMDGGVGIGLVESFGLYDSGPYESVREYVQAVFDRQFHYLDQILHKSTLLAHEAKFKEEMSCLRYSTPEEIFERVKSKRDAFRAHPYDREHPFVLRHGDLHGRNVIVSRSSPRCILGIIDWDFGGSHVLPFADDYFELAHPDSDQDTDQRIKQGEEVYRSELIIDRLIGPPPRDPRLRSLVMSAQVQTLDYASETTPGEDARL